MLAFFAKISGNSGENKVWKSHKKRSPAIALDSLGAFLYFNDVAAVHSVRRNSFQQECYIFAYGGCWKCREDGVVKRAGVWPLIVLLTGVSFKLTFFVASCIIPFAFAQTPMVSESCMEICPYLGRWTILFPTNNFNLR